MLNSDFKEFAGLLNAAGVEYLLVGGYAVAIHGYPRFTGDMDLWVRPTTENARRLMAVLDQFGFGGLGVSEADFTTPGRIVQMGEPPFRIDLLTQIDGVEFEACAARAVMLEVAGLSLPVIGLEDLRRNKLASGRPKDLEDLRQLP